MRWLARAGLLSTLALPMIAVPAPAVLPGQVSLHPAYPNFFFYHQGGPFFMAGPGDPEGFLYRGTQNPDGTRAGDQEQLIAKLAPTGANSIYLMAVRSHGGDGDATENPFVDNDPVLGLNDAVLDQWEVWFDQMDAAGITIFFFLYDDGASIWNSGDSVGAAESAFIHELVDRFEHYRHLIWVVAEEYQERYTPARVSAIAAVIKTADDHHHPVAVHKLSGLDFAELADDPALDQYAIQYNVATAQNIHDGLELAWDDAQRRYNLNMAEAAAWGTGATSRQKAWAAAMAGAYVMVYEMEIAGTPVADLEDLGRLRAFMESTDFYTMEPRDDLAAGDTDYVLAREAKSYILYAGQGAAALGLQDFHAGTYRRRWLDPATGVEVLEDSVVLSAGAQSWPRPAGLGLETAVYAVRVDGANDPPVTLDQSLVTAGTDPLAITLGLLDPDGPGPYAYSIESGPSAGVLTGVAPAVTYTANPGFEGTDAFTWKVSDGIDDSQLAAVSIGVTGNLPPTATSFSLSGSTDTPLALPFADNASDPEGAPLSFTIAAPPTHGILIESSGLWTYTPDAGYVGEDTLVWQASDGVSLSPPAAVALSIVFELFADDFDRPDSATVGNGWTEVEASGQAGISQQALTFDSVDEVERPLVRRSFAAQSSGVLAWTFDLAFRRAGSEGTYAFHMQLGESAAMSDAAPGSAGVAVNLLWGGPSHGFSAHETLGYWAGGSTTELAVVSGAHTLGVEVDLDASTFDVLVDGVTVGATIAFAHPGPIDTLRFYADGLNAQNFPDRRVDDTRMTTTSCTAPDGGALTLSDDILTSIVGYDVCGTIDVGPNWTVAAPGEVTLTAGGGVRLGDGVSVAAGARLIVE